PSSASSTRAAAGTAASPPARPRSAGGLGPHTGCRRGGRRARRRSGRRRALGLGAARERVRVARALGSLPRLAEALACGELSYAKVRALTRVATPATEARLLAVGRAGTAAQIERIVRAGDVWTGKPRCGRRHGSTQSGDCTC